MSLSLCKKCGGPRGLGRRLCKECRKVQARKCAKDSYIRRGGHKKHKHTCPLCKTHFETSRASSTFALNVEEREALSLAQQIRIYGQKKGGNIR